MERTNTSKAIYRFSVIPIKIPTALFTGSETNDFIEQTGEPRSILTLIWPINLQQRRQEYPMGKRQSLQQMVLGKLDSHMQKSETEPLS